MAAAPGQQPPISVLTLDAVRWGVEHLKAQKIHPFFLAYLFLQKWAVEQGTSNDIQPDWDELGRYLEVKGGPPGKPYYRPFWHGQTQDPGRYWLNRNIAGSYSPSSLRQVPYEVIDTVGSHFSLKNQHAHLALKHLLFARPVSAIALGAFLYRDFGFTGLPSDLSPDDLGDVFLRDFHYEDGDHQLEILFIRDLPDPPVVMFEPLEAATVGVE